MPKGDISRIKQYQWQKGKSGNPKGRPKKLPDLKEVLINVLAETKEGRSALEAVLMTMRAKALKGDTRAAELLLDRAYGKAKQENDVLATFTQVIMPLPPAEEVIELHQGTQHQIEDSPEGIKVRREEEEDED